MKLEDIKRKANAECDLQKIFLVGMNSQEGYRYGFIDGYIKGAFEEKEKKYREEMERLNARQKEFLRR